ncbi:MAG: ABC transporter substrate-binding protein [Betaproteobacteria bacterium]|nr:MAG: ABC transporter substrate-binding protein [Betaproteobacteria bacterium]
MDRRTFVGTIGGSLAGVALAAVGQPTKIPVVGFLRTTRPPQSYIDAFEQGLRERGYTPGKNILIEYRLGNGTNAETSRLASELVDLKVDVIVAGGGLATRAAQSVTTTIPIVMSAASDPVGTGLVASLARPGANITGSSIVSWDLFAKRLELLRQVLPNVSRVAVLINRLNLAPANGWNEALAAAATLGVTLQRIDVQSAAEFDDAFATMGKGRAEALIVVQSNIFETAPYRIQQLATSNRIPAMYGLRTSTDAGGLMSYGPSVRDLYAYAAVFVDKILKGAKPADLPVEQPTKFELVINMKTAKALGLTIPQSLLLRADAIIQ